MLTLSWILIVVCPKRSVNTSNSLTHSLFRLMLVTKNWNFPFSDMGHNTMSRRSHFVTASSCCLRFTLVIDSSLWKIHWILLINLSLPPAQHTHAPAMNVYDDNNYNFVCILYAAQWDDWIEGIWTTSWRSFVRLNNGRIILQNFASREENCTYQKAKHAFEKMHVEEWRERAWAAFIHSLIHRRERERQREKILIIKTHIMVLIIKYESMPQRL